MKMIAAMICAVLLAPLATADETASTDTVTVDFIGASGGLKIFPKSDSAAFIMVQQAKLEEVGADGRKVGGGTSINMAGQNSWTALSTTETDNKTVYSTTFSKTTSGGTSFELVAHLARETTTVTENVPCNNCTGASEGGCQRASDLSCSSVVNDVCTVGYVRCNETVPVTKDELKFSIVVQNFPFKNTDNKLQYALYLKDKSGDTGMMEDGGGGANVKTTVLAGGFVETPTIAVIKGGEEDVEVDVVVTTSVQGSKRVITFLFDSFAESESLYYDPVLGVTVNSGAMHGSATATLSLASLAVVAVSSVLAGSW